MIDFHHKFRCHFHVKKLWGYETRNEKKKNRHVTQIQVRLLLSDFDAFTFQ